MKKKALIAMSGGVDSSVAAFLMQQQGFDCGGAIMKLWEENSPAAISDAQAVADRLGMDFHVLDATSPFRREVVDYFIESYEAGLTPNPCIRCNRHLKFSYFLSCLSQRQLAHSRFPLGSLTKEQAREIAREQGFINARKKDSQDICFVPDGDYVAFMKRYTGKEYASGDYLDLNGKVVGSHCGAVCYTLGQRKGLGIALGAPVYVCSKDMQANTVTVGPESALFATTLLADNWSWFPFDTLTAPIRVMAKARYRHIPQPATVYPMENGAAKVVFDTPQRAMTPGQTVALYDGDMVIGGGIITDIL